MDTPISEAGDVHLPGAPESAQRATSCYPRCHPEVADGTLRRLERNGIVERVVISSRPVAVEYRITPLGKTLRHPVDVLLDWATTHLDAIERARREFDAET